MIHEGDRLSAVEVGQAALAARLGVIEDDIRALYWRLGWAVIGGTLSLVAAGVALALVTSGGAW